MRLRTATLGITALLLSGCAGVQQAQRGSEVEVRPYTRPPLDTGRKPPTPRTGPARSTYAPSYRAQVPTPKTEEIYDWAPKLPPEALLPVASAPSAPPSQPELQAPAPLPQWPDIQRSFLEGSPQRALEMVREPQDLDRLVEFGRTFVTEEADLAWLQRARLDQLCAHTQQSQCEAVQSSLREALQVRVESELETCGGESCARSVKLAEVAAPLVGEAVMEQAQSVQARVDAQEARIQTVKGAHIGVLLPLSDETYGKAARESLELIKAAYPNVEFLVRDTKQQADEALHQAQELVMTGQVGALVGPIGTQENLPVSRFARGWGVPHVTLTLSPPPLQPGETERTVRLRTNPLDLAVAVARHARLEQKLGKVAILVEKGPSSLAQANAFASEFKRLGGEVVRVVELADDAKRYDDTMEELLLTKNRRKAKADFEGLYLAVQPARARSFLGHFGFWGLEIRQQPVLGLSKQKPIQVLGQMGWNHPMVFDRATRTTENAVFAEVFFTESREGRTQDFVRRFFSRFNRKPTAFHAEVYDALAFAVETESQARADRAWNRSPREALRRAFSQPRALPAVTGILNVNAQGLAQPRVQLLTIQDETIRARLSEDEEDFMRTQTQPTGPEGQR